MKLETIYVCFSLEFQWKWTYTNSFILSSLWLKIVKAPPSRRFADVRVVPLLDSIAIICCLVLDDSANQGVFYILQMIWHFFKGIWIFTSNSSASLHSCSCSSPLKYLQLCRHKAVSICLNEILWNWLFLKRQRLVFTNCLCCLESWFYCCFGTAYKIFKHYRNLLWITATNDDCWTISNWFVPKSAWTRKWRSYRMKMVDNKKKKHQFRWKSVEWKRNGNQHVNLYTRLFKQVMKNITEQSNWRQ